MISFNLSFSSMNLYRQNPRLFYYQYIAKLAPPDEVSRAYGLAGNVTHDALEAYVNNKPFDFAKEWKDKGLNDKYFGFNEQPLSPTTYKQCVEQGKKLIDRYKILGYKIIPEKKFEMKYNESVNIKGFVDVIAVKDDKILLIDYKTNSSKKKDQYLDQMKFYCWLYYRLEGILPDRCVWYFLKLNKEDVYIPKLKEILEFEKEQHNLINEILEKGDDINKYSINISEIDNPFNAYASLMKGESAIPEKEGQVVLTLRDAKIYFNNISGELIKKLCTEFSFELKQAYFIKKSLIAKGIVSDGYKKFFNIKDNSLEIGFLNRVKSFLTEQNINYIINDERVPLKIYQMPDRLIGKELRDYQQQAVDYAMKHRIVTLEMATSSGKTTVAAEIIRQNKGLTMFLVDRGILLTQTKKEFEEMLGMSIGTITKGEIDLKVVNVATIQTIHSLLKKKDKQLIKILANVKTLITDEGHTVASDMFTKLGKYVLNADIRIGLTGTYNRPDGNEMVIESVVGKNDFIIEADELIKQGYIMKPKIHFYKYKHNYLHIEVPKIEDPKLTMKQREVKMKKMKYHLYYKHHITNNVERNKLLLEIVDKMKDKNILIITSEVEHGELLNESIPNSVFIHGKVDEPTREQWLDKMKSSESNIIIGTASIVQKGLNITNLDIMINATGNDSFIISLQSLGRILRKHKGKEHCYYIDFYDEEPEYFIEHTLNRINTFRNKKHEVTIIK